MSGVDKDISRLEKNRAATFELSGVVAARTKEEGKKTHDAIKHICQHTQLPVRDFVSITLDDGNQSRGAKIDAITAVCDLGDELDWLQSFTKTETEACRFEDLRAEMEEVATTVDGQCNILRNEFLALKVDIESFSDVFDNLLTLLEEMTEFLRLVQRVTQSLDNAYGEAKNLLNVEVVSILVDQAKLTSTRTNDCWEATDELVKIQPGLNVELRPRVDMVDTMLKSCLPKFILETKNNLLTPSSQQRADQEEAYGSLVSCLDEIKAILDLVRAQYVNKFDESARKIVAPTDELGMTLKGVGKAIAELKGAQLMQQPEMILLQKAEAIPKWTKLAIEEMAKLDATPEQQKEFISAVKKARDGSTDDFFKAQAEMNDIIERVRNNERNKPKPIEAAPIVMTLEDPRTQSRTGDLLSAAKEMAAAMAKLNLAIDE